jgi:hypothetical protein
MSKQTDLINVPDAITVSGSNVGIGTSSPSADLDIKRTAGDNNDILRVGSTDNYYHGFARSNTTGALSIQGNQTNFNNILLAPTSGNVGIGTSSPTAGFRTSIKGDYSSIIGGIEFDSGGGDKFTIGHASATSPSGKLNVVGAGNLIMATNNTERMRIDSSGRVTTPYQPAFQAYSTNNGAFGVNAGDTFPLNATHFNIGNCFNTSNYTFTAPVDGYYQLDFMTISTSSQTNIHMNFVFSGNSNMGYNFHFSGNASGGWDTLTMSGVYYMSAGVSVLVRNNTYGITVHGSTWNKFTGYLLG